MAYIEELKKLAEIAEPDERNLYFLIGEGKALSLEYIHKEVESITLDESVPEDIRSHFSQARNLVVYSWFHYPFNVTAQFMGFVTVEMALKHRSGKRSSFKHLIELAVKNNWIEDSGFSVAQGRTEEKSYVETLIDVMPSLRNSLAHGSNMLHPNSVSSLQTCAEFINQLYAEEANK